MKPGNQAVAMVLNPARKFLIDERKDWLSALSSGKSFFCYSIPASMYIFKRRDVYEKTVSNSVGTF